MFSALMQRVGEQLLKELPFVVYRKTQQKEIKGIFQHTDELHLISNFSTSGFVFAPFDSSKKTVLIPMDEQLLATDFTPSDLSSTDDFHFDDTQRNTYLNLVKKAIGEIKKNRFQKVVLSRKIEVEASIDVIKLFQHLLTLYESAFCYLWYHPKVGMWLGATPEILLRTNNLQFTTMSLAGTRPFAVNETTTWGEKELQEQNLVTEYIKVALKNRVTNLRTADLETIRAGNLLHLRTKLTGLLNCELDTVIKSLHPTPAVCGMPKTITKNFILANENYEREFYTGFLGELNFKEKHQRTSNRKNQENQAYATIKTKSELFVNLRCMKVEAKMVSIYVGGGVTSASLPGKEWQETVNKSGTMLRILS